MSNQFHTPLDEVNPIPAAGATINAPLGELDNAIGIVKAEVIAARSTFPSLNDRLDDFVVEMTLGGGNAATLTNGIAAAGQKVVTVDDTTGLIANARCAYKLVPGPVEYNIIDTVNSPTQITLTTNIGAGGIADNTYLCLISESEYQAAVVNPHSGNPTLVNAMEWVGQGVYNVRAFGAVGDGVADDTVAITAAINAATLYSRTIYFPGGKYKVVIPVGGVAFQINTRGLQFIGSRGARPETEGGSSLEVYGGPGSLFQMGTDNGHAYDAGDYDGIQGIVFRDMEIRYSDTTPANITALANGLGNYGTGTYGLRDWRGGDVTLERVHFENWAFGFWGIQSDINNWTNVQFFYNSVGAYFGPRSDQLVVNGGMSFFNDIVMWFDGCCSSRVNDWQTIGDGSANTPAFRYTASAWANVLHAHKLVNPWFENYQGYAGVIPAFVEAGGRQTAGVWADDTTIYRDLVIENPFILTVTSPTTPRTACIVRIGKADGISVINPGGYINNLNEIVEFMGTSNTYTNRLIESSGVGIAKSFVNTGGGGTKILTRQSSYLGTLFGGKSEADTKVTIDSGLTGAYGSQVIFADKNTGKWIFIKVAGNTFELWDSADANKRRLYFVTAAETVVNAGGTEAVKVNGNTNSGTGGLKVYNGGAAPTLIATINNATIFGAASTDTITHTGRMIVRTTASDPQHATPGSRPAGSVGEIAYYGGKMYFCTNAATPTWEKITSV